LIERDALVRELAPPVDGLLATQLVDEFISMERRYIQRDWEPAELDGGQFCEVLARILYQQDAGRLGLRKDLDDCLKYVEDEQQNHGYQPRRDMLHLARVIRTVYKFRSQRGAIHIAPGYGPNQMDARFLMESVRWAMNEVLRIFWNGDRDAVAKAIRELLQFDVPCIGKFQSVLLVQRTDLTAEEEVLVLLHYAGEDGFTRRELGDHVRQAAQRVSDAVKTLTSPARRQAVLLPSERYRLTDLGAKRIREELSAKLLLE
jgi:hypothetical protein